MVIKTNALATHDAIGNDLATFFNVLVIFHSAFETNCSVARLIMWMRLIIVLRWFKYLLLGLTRLALDDEDLIWKASARKALIREVFKQISTPLRLNGRTIFNNTLLEAAILGQMRSVGEQELGHDNQILSYSSALLLAHIRGQSFGFETLVEVILPQEAFENVIFLLFRLIALFIFLVNGFLLVRLEPVASKCDRSSLFGIFLVENFENSWRPRLLVHCWDTILGS